MPSIVYPEFRDQFEFTRYPFSDDALLVSDTNQRIDNDTFLDASLYPIGNSGKLHISAIEIEARAVTIWVSNLLRVRKASVVFDPFDAPDVLVLHDEWDRPAGVLVSEPLRLARFSSWPTGAHTFAIAAAEFVASAVIPTPEIGVRGILTEKDELLTGDVWLVGDNGVVVREDNGAIRVDIVGDPLFVRKLCFPVDLFEPPIFITTINGCAPDEFGNFNLTVGNHENAQTIVRIYPSDAGLVISAIGQTVNKVR
jgi:hypothetical protein